MYRYMLYKSCSPFDSLPLTCYLTLKTGGRLLGLLKAKPKPKERHEASAQRNSTSDGDSRGAGTSDSDVSVATGAVQPQPRGQVQKRAVGAQERAVRAQEKPARRSDRIADRPRRIARTPARDAPALVLCDERRARRSARARVLYVSAALDEGGSQMLGGASQIVPRRARTKCHGIAASIDRCVRDALSGVADLDPAGSLSARHYRVDNITLPARVSSGSDAAEAAAVDGTPDATSPSLPRAMPGMRRVEGVASLRIRARAQPFGADASYVVVFESIEGDLEQFARLAAHLTASLAAVFDVALRPSGAAARRR